MRIAVYGAYGYQGRLVVAELSRRGIDQVLVGRDPARLQAVGPADADRRVADTSRHEGLAAALRGVDAVINCAGPFALSGLAVIRAAIAAGCHYVDTSGEQLHLQVVFDSFSAEAGVSIVPGANDDCLPSDLIAALAAATVAPVEEVTLAIDLGLGVSSPSRGTMRSLLASRETFTTGGVTYDRGTWRPDARPRCTSMTFPGGTQPASVVEFPLPGVVTVPRHLPAARVEGVARAELLAAFDSVTPAFVDTLPDGPALEHRRAATFVVVADVAGSGGRRARGVVAGRDAYGTTAVIAVEAARRLVAEPPGPGALAAAEAFDPAAFLDVLIPHGVTWTVHPDVPLAPPAPVSGRGRRGSRVPAQEEHQPEAEQDAEVAAEHAEPDPR